MNITFQSAGYTLAGNLFVAKNPKKVAFLFIQGWTGHQNLTAAQKVVDLGYTCMTYDMRGNRDSEGDINTFTRADFIDDAVVAYDYLREQVGPEVHIGVIGSSFGGYTAVLLSTRRDVFCLSLRVPATYPNEGLDEIQAPQGDALKASGWRAKPLTYKQNHAFKAMHDFTGKVQIIEAEKDEQVASQGPRNYADAVANKDNLEYILWHDAPHSLVTPQLREEYEAYLLQWIERVI